MARNTPVPRPDCVRRIPGSFSWIDHRFIRDGHMQKLTRDEIALYAFFVLVGNRDGVRSWYLRLPGYSTLSSRRTNTT